MPTKEQQKRYLSLVEDIQGHDFAYYVEAKPTLSDKQYDELYRELLELEAQCPELRSNESPTQRVGGSRSMDSNR